MADVRRAGELLLNERGTEAIRLLANSDHLHSAAKPSDLIADIVHDWHTDYREHLTDRTAPSRMMAEHHTTRRLLNHAAQELLHADGTITGPYVLIAALQTASTSVTRSSPAPKNREPRKHQRTIPT